MSRLYKKEDYTVGLICALDVELAAIQATLDEEHPDLPSIIRDPNAYTLGRIGNHNVVVAALPAGRYGLTASSGVAAHLMRSFPKLRFGLMIGIGGGAHIDTEDAESQIRLGDIVVGNPTAEYGGVFQIDSGKRISKDHFKHTGAMNNPPTILSAAIQRLRAKGLRKGYDLVRYLGQMLDANPRMKKNYSRPAAETDRLYRTGYIHQGTAPHCRYCTAEEPLPRLAREDEEPVVHYGLIGSSNHVMRDSEERDRLHAEYDIICFEMEAAGLVNEFPCIVIRGICDYADSHKNKLWQGYAAAVAAAYGKELLLSMTAEQVSEAPPVAEPEGVGSEIHGDFGNAMQVDEARIFTFQMTPNEKAINYKCLRDLHITNPRNDKGRIEKSNGGLYQAACDWVFENDSYLEWKNEQESRILHVKGPAGKGKTMLLCGLINALERERTFGAYFFFQETDVRINSASAALRGILYMLADADQKLISHIRKEYDRVGKALFEDANSWVALCEILTNMLNELDSKAIETVLVIDALNECSTERDKLLEQIIQYCKKYTHIKWIISSRGGPEIDDPLRKCPGRLRLSLKHNSKAIAGAVNKYINHRVEILDDDKHYDRETRGTIVDYLQANAESTFLWVSLVCKNLEKANSLSKTIERLHGFPPKMNELYARMLQEMLQSENKTYLQTILAAATLMYRPVSLKELRTITGLLCEDKISLKELKDLVWECGGFLTIRESTISFVHQSARMYVLDHAQGYVFPKGVSSAQHEVFLRLIESLSCALKTDILGLGIEENAAVFIGDVRIPSPSPLDGIEYACFYWPRHMLQAAKHIEGDAAGLRRLLGFLEKHLLNWMEALSLFFGVPQLIQRLYEMDIYPAMQHGPPELQELIRDAHKFSLFFKQMMQKYPLQIYHAGLVFSPTNSLIKQTYETEHPEWVKTRMHAEYQWSSELTRLWSHESTITALAYSPDGYHLACGFEDGMLELWNTVSGVMQRRINITTMVDFAAPKSNAPILQRRRSFPIYYHNDKPPVRWIHDDEDEVEHHDAQHSTDLRDCTPAYASLAASGILEGPPPRSAVGGSHHSITEIAFHKDRHTVIFAVDGKRAGLWNTQTEEATRYPELDAVTAPLMISPHGRYMVHGIGSPCAHLYETIPGAPQKILRRDLDHISLITFSPDGQLLATCSRKGLITIWSAQTGSMIGSLNAAVNNIRALALFPDGRRLVIASRTPKREDVIEMTHITTGNIYWRVNSTCNQLYLSPDSQRLVVVNNGHTKLYRIYDGELLKDLRDNKRSLCNFSRNSGQLATTEGGSLRLFTIHAMDNGSESPISPVKLSQVRNAYFAEGHRYIALESPGMLIEVWNVERDRMHHSDTFPDCYISAISNKNAKFAYVTKDSNRVSLLDLKSLQNQPNLSIPDKAGKVRFMKYSSDDRFLAIGTMNGGLFVWDLSNTQSEPYLRVKIRGSPVEGLLWAAKADRLAVKFGSRELGYDIISVWDVAAHHELLNSHVQLTTGSYLCMTISPDGTRLVTTHAKLFEIWDVDKAVLLDHAYRPDPVGESTRFESMALSYDNQLLACASKAGMELWDLSSKTLQQPFAMNLSSFERMAFTEDRSALHLRSGVLDVRQTDSDSVPTLSLGSEKDIFCTKDFVFKNNRPLMWLPEAFRSARTEYRNNRLILHHESGRIALLEFLSPEERRAHEQNFSPISRANTLTLWS